MNTAVFHRDGAPSQCSDRTLRGLTNVVQDGQTVAPIFPRPQPTNYFLWGYLKDRVCQDNPDTIERLQQNTKR